MHHIIFYRMEHNYTHNANNIEGIKSVEDLEKLTLINKENVRENTEIFSVDKALFVVKTLALLGKPRTSVAR
ncbi:MAG: hypothetical protein QXR17_08615 [Candidatus Bathyarchaeia archaeon]